MSGIEPTGGGGGGNNEWWKAMQARTAAAREARAQRAKQSESTPEPREDRLRDIQNPYGLFRAYSEIAKDGAMTRQVKDATLPTFERIREFAALDDLMPIDLEHLEAVYHARVTIEAEKIRDKEKTIDDLGKEVRADVLAVLAILPPRPIESDGHPQEAEGGTSAISTSGGGSGFENQRGQSGFYEDPRKKKAPKKEGESDEQAQD